MAGGNKNRHLLDLKADELEVLRAVLGGEWAGRGRDPRSYHEGLDKQSLATGVENQLLRKMYS